MSRLERYATPVLTVAGGLCLGQGIRSAMHSGQMWPLLIVASAALWAGAAATLWLPYRAERNRLLRKRALLLDMKRELDEMAQHGHR